MNRLVHLQTFLEIYRCGSVTRAARKLGITQPAASLHLASLEAMMERPLFRREARGVVATPAADDLARSIAQHLDGLETTLHSALARSPHLAGTVHIVGPAEYMTSRLAPSLTPLVAEGLEFRIQTGNRDRIYSALDDGHADLAVTASHPTGQKHGFEPLDRERLVLVSGQEIASRMRGREITAKLLQELPCIAYDESLPLIRTYFEAAFGVQIEAKAAVTAPDLRILKSFAIAGAGWTVLPDYLCEDDVIAGSLTEFGTGQASPFNQLYLVWNRSALRHPRVVYVRDALLR